MILQALYNYYITMQAQQDNAIAPLGMEYKNIPFIIVIDMDGNFVRIEDTRSKSNNNKGESFLVAQSLGRSGSKSSDVANRLWDHKGYVLCYAKDNTDKGKSNAIKQHESFVKKIKEICEIFPDNKEFNAVKAFYEKEESLIEIKGNGQELIGTESSILPHKNDIFNSIQLMPGANISFMIRGMNRIVASHPDIKTLISMDQSFLNNDDAISNDLPISDSLKGNEGICLITGKKGRLIRLHKSMGSMLGAKATASLVSFQTNSGYDSYGKTQGLNAPISEEASFAMTTALIDLLKSGRETNYKIGDMKLIFWNAQFDKTLIETYKAATFDPPESDVKPKKKRKTDDIDELYSNNSYKVYDALKAIIGSKDGYIDKVSEDRFYILGLTPNSGRIAVKLWQEGSVREIVGNTLQHLQDMNIISWDGLLNESHPPLRNLYSIVKSVSIGTQDKWQTNLIEAIIHSIVSGKQYPHTLQLACLNRMFQERNVTSLRAAILKAYLIRNHKYTITMALDPQNNNKAYLCGRLFAILEKIQQNADPEVKGTIRVRYFTAAAKTPALVFGMLTQLSNHHLSKIKKDKLGLSKWLDQQLCDIYNLFPGKDPNFPLHFKLDEQSLFAVGYYHQKAISYNKKDEEK
ncbi:type I-C CRISPR-associated protein Cas8c/Csd1 [Porphyromonas pogonae]|uniref:type I-C CRISPR-associated protein Cas8c/Csd1 n=1 Tax=Porphyromonas pogonae TaxID=867595 RepID=UPI002E79DDCB|nr:type I-C CRISPR-associated protein Cas8c/Csd1 [Porphyromonas pogonae]